MTLLESLGSFGRAFLIVSGVVSLAVTAGHLIGWLADVYTAGKRR